MKKTDDSAAKTSGKADGESDVMTLSEMARYLKVPERTVVRMATAREIPGTRVSDEWRFLRPLIDDWLSSRMQASPDEALIDVIRTARPVVPLSRLVSRERVVMDILPGTVEEVLRQLMEPVVQQGLVRDAEAFLKQLVEREAAVSTGIEKGMAIPHARDPETSGVTQTCVVVGICGPGTEFHALIDGPTHVFCLLCAGSLAEHLRLVAEITLLFRAGAMVEKLCSAAAAEDVIQLLMNADCALAMSF